MEASSNLRSKKRNINNDEDDFYKTIKQENDALFKNLKSKLLKNLNTRRSETVNVSKKVKVLKGIIININYFNKSVDISRRVCIDDFNSEIKKTTLKKVKGLKKSKRLTFLETSELHTNSKNDNKKKISLTSIKTETANTTIPSEENGTDRSNSIKNIKKLITCVSTPNQDSNRKNPKDKKKICKKKKNPEENLKEKMSSNSTYTNPQFCNYLLYPQIYLPYPNNQMFQILDTKPLNVEK